LYVSAAYYVSIGSVVWQRHCVQGFGSTECSMQRARPGKPGREVNAEDFVCASMHHMLHATSPAEALPALGFEFVLLQVCMHLTYTLSTSTHNSWFAACLT
jgi:hypothetical protein